MILPLRADPRDPEFVALLNGRLEQLDTAIEALQAATAAASAATSSSTGTDSVSGGLSGLHSRRLILPAGTLPVGTVFYETDRTHWYGVAEDATGVRVWRVINGEMEGTIYSPNQKPTDLGADDKGFLFYSTDYVRLFRWTGTAWVRAKGEFVTLAGATSPVSIGAAGWKVMDGSGNPVRYSQDDGTTDTITLPDATGAYEAQGTWTGTVDAAVTPGLTGSTAAAGGHDHDVTTTDHTHDVSLPGHTHPIDHDHPSATTGAGSSGVAVTAAGAATAATSAHTHTFDVPALTGSSGFGGGTTVTSLSDGGETVTSASEPDHSHGAGTLAVDGTGRPPTLKVFRAVKL